MRTSWPLISIWVPPHPRGFFSYLLNTCLSCEPPHRRNSVRQTSRWPGHSPKLKTSSPHPLPQEKKINGDWSGVITPAKQSGPGDPSPPARELIKLIQGIKKSFAETGAAHGREGTLHPAADVMRPGEGRGALASVFGPNPGCATYLL